MDPVSVIGVAAASIQFADIGVKALLGSIRTLQNLRDAPKQIAVLLHDVDKSIKRLADLETRLQDDTDPLAQRLSRDQHQTLRDVVSEGCQAVVDFQNTLGRVKSLPGDSKARKVWKSFLGVEMSRDIEIHLSRIQRQHSETLQQLQLAGLDVALAHGEQITQTENIVKDLNTKVDELATNLEALRLHVLTMIPSQCIDHDGIQTIQQQPSGLTHEENIQLNKRVREDLLQYPKALRDSCDSVGFHLNAHQRLRSLPDQMDLCQCFANERTGWTQQFGIIGLRYESQEPHQRSCPLYGDRSWRYAFSLQLIPFLRRTVEFAFGATYQGGGFSIAPPLTTWTTVKRSESPMFRLFDEFVDKWLCPFVNKRQGAFRKAAQAYVLLNIPFGERRCWRWYRYDVSIVEGGLEWIRQRLLSQAAEGTQPWWIRDENGSTLAYELLVLLQILTDRRKTFTLNMRPLFELAALGFIDPLSAPKHLNRIHSMGFGAIGPVEAPNSLDMIYYTTTLAARSFVDSPITQSILTLGFDHEYAFDIRAASGRERHELLTLFQRHDELIPVNAFRGLLWATLQRDVKKVNYILQQISREEIVEFEYSNECYALSPLECALGWTDGLRSLLQAGHNPTYAIELAIYRCDVKSIHLLLSAKPSLLETSCLLRREGDAMFPHWFIHAATVTSSKVHRCVAHQLRDMYLGSPRKSHIPAYYAYFAKLNFMRVCRDPIQVGFLDELYDAGFTNIDSAGVRKGWTPLQFIGNGSLSALLKEDVEYLCDLIIWFLDRGGSPIFQQTDLRPSLIHWLAFHIRIQRDSNVWHDSNIQLKKISQLIRQARCNLLEETDNCDCPCSSSGCLPLRWLLRCDKMPNLHEYHFMCKRKGQQELDGLISTFLSLNNATQDQIELYESEGVRLELFDRLGMTHTCCHGGKKLRGPRLIPTREFRLSIRWNERKLKSLLGFIVKLFAQFSRQQKSPSEEMLQRWWSFLDPILPEVPPNERCSAINKDRNPEKHGEYKEIHGEDEERSVWESEDEEGDDSAWETEDEDSEDEGIATIKRQIWKVFGGLTNNYRI
ncbi:hypothetical protein EDB81DRAFT_860557 [Dactylonectria macrodidyma]|uniref:Fungal N-terminal domain-containing protein n=1 Tax=Dactylonectria macrodidyma TaxID=307937 RepID=A0A9P9DVL2_9HYPO|nr:hypothetical protein EDB81DRAFT_860557 [Dactylonectria macrodidyma]